MILVEYIERQTSLVHSLSNVIDESVHDVYSVTGVKYWLSAQLVKLIK